MAAKNSKCRLFYKSHMFGVYEFQKPFCIDSCKDGRVSVNPGALCTVQYDYESDTLQFKFLRTKNTLPISASYSMMSDFDSITSRVHLPERGDIVEHNTYGYGTVKNSNGVDILLVEFGTIDEETYKRDWFSISELKYSLEDEKEETVENERE